VAGVPAGVGRARATRGAAAHLGRPPGSGRCDHPGVRRGELAALQSPLPPERGGAGPQERSVDGARAVGSIFKQPDRAAGHAQVATVCATLRDRFPPVVQLLAAAEAQILTFCDFPPAHWSKIASTNPYERLNKELKRRSAVYGIFPNKEAAIRLFGAVLAEQNDECLVTTHYGSAESMQALRRPRDVPEQLSLEVPVA